MRVPVVASAVVGLGSWNTPDLSRRVKAGFHFAQHARCDRTPDGEQYSQKDKEPNA